MAFSAHIDGTDITGICQSIRWRSALSRPSTGIVTFPGHLFQVQTGISEMHLYDGATLVFSGPVWFVQSDGGPNSAYVQVTAYDHLIYLVKRLCKVGTTPPGNLITPGDVLLTQITAPAILSTYIQNTITIDGTLPLAVGTVAAGGADVSGVPTDFPMSIDRMRILLISTGQLDVVVNPGIGSSTLDFANGDSGSDLSGSVVFGYGTGAFNCQIATKTEDMEDVINALWYLLGPRKTEERWAGSITPSAANGGVDGNGPLPGDPWPPALVTRFMQSRSVYGYMQEIRVFDDKGDENSIRPLFEEEWANEAWIRATPRTFASIRPERGTPLLFSVGDIIGVQGGSSLNGGFTGTERIYEFELSVDPDGVYDFTEILTSSDQEGA